MELSVQLHASAALPPGKNHGLDCVGGYVGPRAGLDVSEKKCLDSEGRSNPGLSSQERSCYTNCIIPAPDISIRS
jgi:hypothetical protein